MQLSSRLLFRTTLLLLGMFLAVALFVVVVNANNQANAITGADWTTVKNNVAAYMQYQSGGGEEGEGGFLMSSATLNTRINSDPSSGILGEGDDAGTAPVMIDNLGTQATWIPGTAERCQWNVGAGLTGYSANCFDGAMIARVQTRVNAHAEAGFSTDLVDYCVSGKTEAPTTGAWGYIAQTGLLRADGAKIHVYALKWGRNGWTNVVGTSNYNRTGTIGPASTNLDFTPPTSNAGSSNCNSTYGTQDLVRCSAQQAIYTNVGSLYGMTGGNVGNGQSPAGTAPAATLTAGAVIDTRTGTPGDTVTNKTTYQIPSTEIFDNSLGANMGMRALPMPATTTLLVGARTSMMGGIVAEGLKMLGYGTATGGFIGDGLKMYNNTLGGGWVADGGGRAALASTAIDFTPPTISGAGVPNVSTDQADIVRSTVVAGVGEPATSKVHLVGSDSHVVDANNTVLNGYKVTHLTGLHPGVTYTGTLTVYDGQANGSSTPISFTTLKPDTTPPVVTVSSPTIEATGPTGAPASYTASAVDAVYGSLPTSCDVAPGDPIPFGPTTVTCTATDPWDNTGTGSGTMTVVDTTPPTVSITNVVIGPSGPGGAIVTYDSTASDIVDGSMTPTCAPASGTNFPVGTTTINCSATDAHSNTGTASQEVTVVYICTGRPDLSLAAPVAFWFDYTAYQLHVLSVTWTVNNNGANDAYSVVITSSTSTYGPITTVPGWAAIGDIPAGNSGSTVIQYQLPGYSPTGFGFHVINTASANDCAANSYTYP